jgi:penicillin-insensitive murein endopeptidase
MRYVALVCIVRLLAGEAALAETPTATDEDAPAVTAGLNRHAIPPGNVVTPVKPSEPSGVAAKTLFGTVGVPAPLAARAIGSYARGCLAGGVALPVDGPAWQAMRLSRNRNWGHPNLIALVQRFAEEAKSKDGWPGLLVGDISQPRGGPMLTGHASHQIGLDADVWFTPMPNRRLSRAEREEMSAVSMLDRTELAVDAEVFGDAHVRLLKRAAGYPEVERVLVHPAIKKAICQKTAGQTDRAWLSKVRPIWGHFYHFHIRIGCPAGVAGCAPQRQPPGDDGCGKELDDWFKVLMRPPAPPPPGPSKPAPPPLTLAQLPADCRVVLETGRK